MTTSYVDQVALADHVLLASTDCTLLNLIVVNTQTDAVYVQLFNSGAQPTDGDVPLYSLPCAGGGGSFTFTPPALNSGASGRRFPAGCWLVGSTTPDTLTEIADTVLQCWAVVGSDL